LRLRQLRAGERPPARRAFAGAAAAHLQDGSRRDRRRDARGDPAARRVPPRPHHAPPGAGPALVPGDGRVRARRQLVKGPTLQELIFKLQSYWSARGCLIQQALDIEVGAGTMHPETFLRVLGPEPWRVAYVQPSRRPADGRYGENPNRLYKHLQLQVIL